MVMTATQTRLRKTGAATSAFESNKGINRNDHIASDPVENPGLIVSSVSDNVDMLSNDQGDVFFGPAPKISFKLDDSYITRSADSPSE